MPRMWRKGLGAVCAACGIWASAGAARAATPGFVFLHLDPVARAAAMGDVQATLGGEAANLYGNPATLTQMPGRGVSLNHVEWFQDFRVESAALAAHTNWATIGAMITGVYAGSQDFVLRDENGAEGGHFGYYDLAAQIAAARTIGHGVAVGVGGKVIVEEIDDARYGGVAADVGVTWTASSAPGLVLGAVATNLGPASTNSGTTIALPRSGRIGARYLVPVAAFEGSVLIAAEFESRRGDDSHVHLGAEVRLHKSLVLDAGWKSGYDSQDVSLGGGVESGRVAFHYAFLPTSTELGSTHRLSLALGL